MLQSPASDFLSECPEGQDFPFGHLEINDCVRLPQAYRSLPRPFSLPKPNHPPNRIFDLDFSNLGLSNY